MSSEINVIGYCISTNYVHKTLLLLQFQLFSRNFSEQISGKQFELTLFSGYIYLKRLNSVYTLLKKSGPYKCQLQYCQNKSTLLHLTNPFSASHVFYTSLFACSEKDYLILILTTRCVSLIKLN